MYNVNKYIYIFCYILRKSSVLQLCLLSQWWMSHILFVFCLNSDKHSLIFTKYLNYNDGFHLTEYTILNKVYICSNKYYYLQKNAFLQILPLLFYLSWGILGETSETKLLKHLQTLLRQPVRIKVLKQRAVLQYRSTEGSSGMGKNTVIVDRGSVELFLLAPSCRVQSKSLDFSTFSTMRGQTKRARQEAGYCC